MHPGIPGRRRVQGSGSKVTFQDADDSDGGGDEELEELLQAQAEFGRSGKAPSAKCVRAPRQPSDAHPAERLGAAEDGGKGEAVGRKRPPSLFKQLRQGHVEGKPFGIPTLMPHPEITALPELEGPGKEELSCLAKCVSERSPPAGACGGGPRQDGTANVPCFVAPSTGFPMPAHRSVGQFLGSEKPSAHLDIREQEADDGPMDEEKEIDKSNRQALSKASPEEIYEWQQQLLQQLGKETCDFLKRRGQEKTKLRADVAQGEALAREKAPEDPTEGATTGDGFESSTTADKAAASCKPPLKPVNALGVGFYASETCDGGGAPHLPEGLPNMDSFDALRTLAGGCLDSHELQKLQWTMPPGEPDFDAIVEDESLPPEPSGKVTQLLRFDFQGRVCLRTNSSESECSGEVAEAFTGSEGLHHHGAECSQAGYTLAELLLLSRSTNMPQRALALTVLACVLDLARVPIERETLAKDPALSKIFESISSSGAPRQAGFGMGLCVFFWHAVARGDISKHLAEALADTALPVQVAALRGIATFFDGCGTSGIDVVRGHPQRATNGHAHDGCVALDAWLGSPFHAACELVWPSAPPPSAAWLARRPRVAVVTPEGGAGGGSATWPHLLRHRLLSAKREAEVTGADVLEPLLPAVHEDGESSSLSPMVVGVSRCFPLISTDDALVAIAIRALLAACLWSPALCCKVLDTHRAYRSQWLKAGAAATCTGDSAQLRLQVLRLIRCSCQVGGLTAATWWLAKGPDQSAADSEDWTTVAVVRRAVLDVCAASDFQAAREREQHPAGIVRKICAAEGVYIWLTWLRHGAGADALDSFAPSFGRFWHHLAQCGPDLAHDNDVSMECNWLIAGLLLRLACCLATDREAGSDAEGALPPLQPRAAFLEPCGSSGARSFLVAAAAEAARPLAVALAGAAHEVDASVARQLCLAALANLIAAAPEVPAFADAGRLILAAQPSGEKAGEVVPQFDDAVGGSGTPHLHFHDDEEAPWPFGGAARGQRLQRLARLYALRALCGVARHLGGPSALPWLRRVVSETSRRVACLAGPMPSCSESREGLMGPTQQDPWPALLTTAITALASCGEASAAQCRFSGPLTRQSLELCGCWPTARATFACMDLHFGEKAEEAIVRAAFRPEAPWARIPEDLGSRTARAAGRPAAPAPGSLLPSPEAAGPPYLAFAAAPFWALAASPPIDAATELLEVLASPQAAPLAAAAPAWLPFVAFTAFLAAPPWSSNVESQAPGAGCGHDDRNASAGEQWPWSNGATRPLLRAFAMRHLSHQDPSVWLASLPDWLSATLRGLCDRLATIFTEESFGDDLVANALWGFAASGMPAECRAVCWGSQDPAVLVLLSRALPVPTPLNAADGPLLWPLKAYIGPPLEDIDVVERAAEVIGTGTNSALGTSSWPLLLATHHLARHDGRVSAFDTSGQGRKAMTSPRGTAAAAGSLDEME